MAHNPQNPPQSVKLSKEELKALTGAPPPRMHEKTREAINLLVRTGMTQRWVAEQVGMNENALGRALRKPHIAKYYEQQKIIAMQDLKAVRKMGEVAALQVGIELMQTAQSEAVRARMVEFFAAKADARGPQTVVNVQNHGVTGYEMARPGQRIVDITPDQDEKPKQVTRNQHDDSGESQ